MISPIDIATKICEDRGIDHRYFSESFPCSYCVDMTGRVLANLPALDAQPDELTSLLAELEALRAQHLEFIQGAVHASEANIAAALELRGERDDLRGRIDKVLDIIIRNKPDQFTMSVILKTLKESSLDTLTTPIDALIEHARQRDAGRECNCGGSLFSHDPGCPARR